MDADVIIVGGKSIKAVYVDKSFCGIMLMKRERKKGKKRIENQQIIISRVEVRKRSLRNESAYVPTT